MNGANCKGRNANSRVAKNSAGQPPPGLLFNVSENSELYQSCRDKVIFNLQPMTDFATAIAAYQTFPTRLKSLTLSTVNANGTPHASFAPFINDQQRCIYIYTSELSTHTQNLLSRPQASILIAADEADSPQIFARPRLTYDCHVSEIERQSPTWVDVLTNFEQRFGNIMQMLKTLKDFHLFCLTPFQGRFVMGFGAAYAVDPQDLSQLMSQPVKG